MVITAVLLPATISWSYFPLFIFSIFLFSHFNSFCTSGTSGAKLQLIHELLFLHWAYIWLLSLVVSVFVQCYLCLFTIYPLRYLFSNSVYFLHTTLPSCKLKLVKIQVSSVTYFLSPTDNPYFLIFFSTFFYVYILVYSAIKSVMTYLSDSSFIIPMTLLFFKNCSDVLLSYYLTILTSLCISCNILVQCSQIYTSLGLYPCSIAEPLFLTKRVQNRSEHFASEPYTGPEMQRHCTLVSQSQSFWCQSQFQWTVLCRTRMVTLPISGSSVAWSLALESFPFYPFSYERLCCLSNSSQATLLSEA